MTDATDRAHGDVGTDVKIESADNFTTIKRAIGEEIDATDATVIKGIGPATDEANNRCAAEFYIAAFLCGYGFHRGGVLRNVSRMDLFREWLAENIDDYEAVLDLVDATTEEVRYLLFVRAFDGESLGGSVRDIKGDDGDAPELTVGDINAADAPHISKDNTVAVGPSAAALADEVVSDGEWPGYERVERIDDDPSDTDHGIVGLHHPDGTETLVDADRLEMVGDLFEFNRGTLRCSPETKWPVVGECERSGLAFTIAPTIRK